MNNIHKQCAILSDLIYNPLFVVDGESQTFEIENNKIGIIAVDGVNYVVFQGSNDLEDWISNFTFSKTDIGFHSGFSKASDKIEKALEKELEKDKEYIFTGHSMGGALALILGMRIKAKEIVTFGQPRVLSEVDNDCPIDHIHRYLTPEDIIPNTPPSIFGYKHIGEPYFILNNFIYKGEMKLYDKFLHKIHKSAQQSIKAQRHERNLILSVFRFIISYASLQFKNSTKAHSHGRYNALLNKS
jgi:hypothetical protein